MPKQFFQGIFDTDMTAAISAADFLLCIGTALLAGLFLSAVYRYQSHYTKTFAATLALLPAIVCVVIILVNGSVGTGVAVAGTFSLVRFRSVPGTAKEICAIFLAMSTGLAAGMGYLGYALLTAVLLGTAGLLLNHLDFRNPGKNALFKTLQITIPEDLDYAGVFDELLEEYSSKYELTQVKTANMGSLFRLTYSLVLKKSGCEKELIDRLRCRNGNLEIMLTRQTTENAEL